MRNYEGVGFFESQWRNPPPSFNPLFDPNAAARFASVTASMEADGFYISRSRAECKAEWERRYDALKATGN
jgi:hypothetical protein